MAQTDLEILEKSLAFHQARLKTWGKPRTHKWILPYDDTDPRYVIPSLERIVADLKADIAKMSKKTKNKKA